MNINIGASLTCPCCGCGEVVDNTLPIAQQRLNIRGYKIEKDGRWWSECLPCKTWFTDDGYVSITNQSDPAMRERLGLGKTGVYHFEWSN